MPLDRYAALGITFRIVDMSEPLPFANGSFDAVMSNVAAHMFSHAVTRKLFVEAKRVARPGGLLLLHVNSGSDRALRAERRPIKRELEPNYVLEESGQTVRFFSRDYLLDVLAGWEVCELTRVEVTNVDTGEPFKRLWRVAARRPLEPAE